jgi:hypothetical protein
MMLLAPVTNWEPHGVTLVGYCYTMMKIQIVIPYRVSHLQRYGVTVRGNVTSLDIKHKKSSRYSNTNTLHRKQTKSKTV